MDNIKVIKRKESYSIYNLSSNIGYYSVSKKSCSVDTNIETGNIGVNESINFVPKTDGEYTISITLGTTTEKIIITHYPTLIKSVVEDIEKALCVCDCGCGENEDCLPKEAKQCLLHQNLYAEIQMLLFLIKTLTNCKENANIIKVFIEQAIEMYKCDLYALFCAKVTEIHIKGEFEYVDKLQKKLLAINYLGFYLYEKSITDESKEYLDFLDNKYKYKTIKDCLLKAGIDVSDMEELFSSILYDNCYVDETDTVPCSFNCFSSVIPASIISNSFSINEPLNGIYHTFAVKNTCIEEQIFINKTLYEDTDFKVISKVSDIDTFVPVLPNETIDVNIIFIGTKPNNDILNIPFVYEGALLNTYKITFS